MSIKIEQLLPLLKKGWVAMDEDGDWYWYPLEPDTNSNREWRCNVIQSTYTLKAFDIAPVDDWTQSLMRCGNE